MEQWINELLQYLLQQNPFIVYFFLFLSAVIENLFPPIPGDTITAFGAFLVGTGRLNYILTYIATTSGSVIGFMSLFYLGKFLQKEFFINKNYKYFPVEKIIAAEAWFARFGYFVVLANRFLPGIRSVISLVSGMSQLSAPRVLIFSLISASVWNLIWIHTGYLLGTNWEQMKEHMTSLIQKYNIGMGILLTIGILAYFIYRYWKKNHPGTHA
jgi:membrane protein DedA with SNARE-associated domain